jgi:hypothetical protein
MYLKRVQYNQVPSTYTKSFKVSLYAALAPKIILPLVALEVEEIVTSPERSPS